MAASLWRNLKLILRSLVSPEAKINKWDEEQPPWREVKEAVALAGTEVENETLAKKLKLELDDQLKEKEKADRLAEAKGDEVNKTREVELRILFSQAEWKELRLKGLRMSDYLKYDADELARPYYFQPTRRSKAGDIHFFGLVFAVTMGAIFLVLRPGVFALDSYLAEAEHGYSCDLEPHMTCVFFEPQCLSADETARRHVQDYMRELTGGLNLWNLSQLFISNILLLTLATAGGLPV